MCIILKFDGVTQQTDRKYFLLFLSSTGVRQMQTADLQTCRPADLQTCRPAHLQTCRPADLQTQHTGLSQFILKIILCKFRHSISCAVRLVRFDTWLLSRLSFRNKIRTCASFGKTLSNYVANSIIRARF